MTSRNLTISINEFYHLYSRGVDKRPIFLDDNDKKRFMRLLFICNGTEPVVYKMTKNMDLSEIPTGDKLVAIGAYCLMPNHFHLLVKEIEEGGAVKFMSKLLTAYSSYFNKKYERVGALFGSEFKSEHADSDPYLKYLFAYIHLNPLKLYKPDWREAGLDPLRARAYLGQYEFSSYGDYARREREEGLILEKGAFPDYFSDSKEYWETLAEWIKEDPESYPHPRPRGGLGKTGDNSSLVTDVY